jgi:hypothetical protein
VGGAATALRIGSISHGRYGGDDTSTLFLSGSSYTDGKRTIPVDAVSHLRDVLRASERTQNLVPADLGITPESVREHHNEILRAAGLDPAAPLPPGAEEAISYNEVVQYAESLVEIVHADHFTRTGVRSDGPSGFSVWTDQAMPLTLPWSVTMNGRSWITYSPDVSHAVAALLPAGSHRDLVEDSFQFWSHSFWHSSDWRGRLSPTAQH